MLQDMTVVELPAKMGMRVEEYLLSKNINIRNLY